MSSRTIVAAAVVSLASVLVVGGGAAPAGARPERERVAARAQTFTVDPVHSSIVYRIKHANTAFHYGRFNEFSGTFSIDEANPAASSIEIEIKLAGIDSGNAKRDAHLASPDFFNAREFPVATFKSTRVTRNAQGSLEVTGDFTLRGVTKPITATLTHYGTGSFQGRALAGFETAFEIKRSDFGVNYGLAPDGSDSGALANTVRVIVSLEGAAG